MKKEAIDFIIQGLYPELGQIDSKTTKSGKVEHYSKPLTAEASWKTLPVKELWNFTSYSFSGDEYIWALLDRLEFFPGGNPNLEQDVSLNDVATRYIIWREDIADYYNNISSNKSTKIQFQNYGQEFCQGYRLRNVCVFGLWDLYFMLNENKFLFANKFDTNHDPRALECLDSYLRNKAIDQAEIEFL